jgi:hypothetical protein
MSSPTARANRQARRVNIDAATGEVLYREDIVRYQQQLQPSADVFPTYPCISKKLQDEGILDTGQRPHDRHGHTPHAFHHQPAHEVRHDAGSSLRARLINQTEAGAGFLSAPGRCASYNSHAPL